MTEDSIRVTPEMAAALERLCERELYAGPDLDMKVAGDLARAKLARIGKRLIVRITDLGREVLK